MPPESLSPGEARQAGLKARLLDRAEELVYRMNERQHWLFRLWDSGNELWAALYFRFLRRRAAAFERPVHSRSGVEARLRLLQTEDEEAFAQLLSGLGARYLPPHPIDRASARRALRRRSYLPFGIFVEGRLVGYLLLRLFFPRRAVTGIWTLPETHNLGLGQESLRHSRAFTRGEDLPDYCTIPVDNENSLRMATAAGFRILRTNRRFHVLRH